MKGLGLTLLFYNAIAQEDPCKNGSCDYAPSEENDKCGLWMGPSPIKEHEEHGFGLGMFTGKSIKEDEIVSSDIFIPIFDWEGAIHHPPLLEYTWRAGVTTERFNYMSQTGGLYFIPGVGTIVPCTSQNFNIENIDTFDELDDNYDTPISGSFSIYKSNMYRAVRDIAPGEELTVECTDDDFDGGNYNLNRYNPKDDGIMCLDDNLIVQDSNYLDAGKGVFSKGKLKKGEVILSTPLVPIDRQEMTIPKDIVEDYNVPEEQLLMNYCFGHPNSDLLWLPFGTIANYMNHNSTPNVKVQWHEIHDHISPTKRQSYHHPELFTLSSSEVAKVHGMGLLFDYVALRDIEPNEEIFIDYGKEWVNAMEQHVKTWKQSRVDYMTAIQYQKSHDVTVLRTFTEQLDQPYPSNIQFLCQISSGWEDPASDAGKIEHFYDEDDDHSCLIPCTIQDRYELGGIIEDNMFYHLRDDLKEDDPRLQKFTFYRVILLEQDDNDNVDYDCKTVPEVEYTYSNVPRSAIGIVDKPYSTTMSQSNAFRHPIGVHDLYPDIWLKRRVRKKLALTAEDVSTESFKRKKPLEPVQKKATL